jgi:hypothetical protein
MSMVKELVAHVTNAEKHMNPISILDGIWRCRICYLNII